MSVVHPLKPSRLRRWRWPLVAAVTVFTGAGAFIGVQMFRSWRAAEDLRAAITELDQTEPDWRIEAVEAGRTVVPDAENSVPLILRTSAPIRPMKAAEYERLQRLFADLSPEVRLTDDQYHTVIDMLEELEPVASRLAALIRYPRGRCPIQYAPDGFSGDLVIINETRKFRDRPLNLLILAHAHEGNPAAGVTACVIQLHLAGAIGDEPTLSSQIMRGWHARYAVSGMERLLGQGAVAGPDLATFQEKLVTEAAFDPWPIALRGDRAMHHLALSAVARGALAPSTMRMYTGHARPTNWIGRAREWIGDQFPAEVPQAHVWVLRRWTQLLRETESAPWHERALAVAQFTADQERAPGLARRSPFFFQVSLDRLQTTRAYLLTGLVAVAAERFRINHEDWPESLNALTPAYLTSVPLDPFDGQPLRIRRLPDGIIFYSVGPDGADDRGNLASMQVVLGRRPQPVPGGPSLPRGSDVGFRLWNISHRSQPPPGPAGGPP
jgi:hypothetical protein